MGSDVLVAGFGWSELRIWIGKRMACIVLISLSLCLIIRLVEFKHNINIPYEQFGGYKT